MVDPHERLTHVAAGQLLLQRAMVMTWLETPVYRCPDLRIAQLCRIAEIDAALRMLLDGGQSNGEPGPQASPQTGLGGEPKEA